MSQPARSAAYWSEWRCHKAPCRPRGLWAWADIPKAESRREAEWESTNANAGETFGDFDEADRAGWGGGHALSYQSRVPRQARVRLPTSIRHRSATSRPPSVNSLRLETLPSTITS